MQKLINSVQNYAWGSHTALTELYGIANPDNLPMAELWMGRTRRAARRFWTPTDAAFAARRD
jgi:mannose-6-phosphate isomerase